MRHRTLQTIAERLADTGVATFRYNFPYMERGGGGRDSQAMTLATVRSAVAAAHAAAPDLPLLAGGTRLAGA
jgi:predicted alpha/beta-hydrolase family hydrolase